MELVKRLVLDVLKPHSPNPLEFARKLVSLSEGYEVRLVVEEMDPPRFAFRFVYDPDLPAETGNSPDVAGERRYGLLVLGP